MKICYFCQEENPARFFIGSKKFRFPLCHYHCDLAVRFLHWECDLRELEDMNNAKDN